MRKIFQSIPEKFSAVSMGLTPVYNDKEHIYDTFVLKIIVVHSTYLKL